MKLSVDEKKINFLGEFSDKNLESDFFRQYMQRAMRYIKPLIVLLGLLNTLFLIPDYFLMTNFSTYKQMAIARIVFATLVVMLFLCIKHVRSNKIIAVYITACEVLAVLLFLFIYFIYESPDYLIQAFGVIVLLIAVYIVSNRWIYSVGVSLFMNIGFLIISLNLIENIKPSNFWAGAVYIWIITILCGMVSFYNNYIERINYINRKELVRLSTIDPLSGACNRTKLDEEMNKWIEYSKRYNVPLSVAILDFDDFKKINDTFGHLIGDNVIVEASQIIRKTIRKSDIFARWGGEEFILLLPCTDVAKATELTERIRRQIEQNIFDKAGKVTCSIGIAQLSEEDDMLSFLRRTDKTLYSAKEDGKNKVMTYKP